MTIKKEYVVGLLLASVAVVAFAVANVDSLKTYGGSWSWQQMPKIQMTITGSFSGGLGSIGDITFTLTSDRQASIHAVVSFKEGFDVIEIATTPWLFSPAQPFPNHYEWAFTIEPTTPVNLVFTVKATKLGTCTVEGIAQFYEVPVGTYLAYVETKHFVVTEDTVVELQPVQPPS